MKGINSDGVRKEVVNIISSRLDNLGLMYRIFSRSKDKFSLEKKLSSNPKYGLSKKLQDLIGVRIVLYFNDDIVTTRSIVSSLFEEKSSDVSIDEVTKEEFKAVRYNIVYKLGEDFIKDLNLGDQSSYIDSTFELQIRTVFSEGWHEIEHDLRYKNKSDWEGFDAESRLLNGVYASLENSEWTMIKIFDELAYSHYKAKQWDSMFRQKLRLRFKDEGLSSEILEILDNNPDLAKKLFRVERNKLINEMNSRGFYYPVSVTNLVIFSNAVFFKDENVIDLTPPMMLEEINL